VHKHGVAALSASLLVMLTGCSTPTGGQPQPAASTPDSAATLPHSGAPKVRKPLDQTTLTRVQQNPCSTLTAAQVKMLRLSPKGTAEVAQAGPTCRWSNVDTGSAVQVYFLTKIVYDGLSQVYLTNKIKGRAKFFYEMADIGGFPVVASSPIDLRTSRGSCPVQVGLTDRQVMDVSVTVSRARLGRLEPCAAARDVAGMALSTMKSGV
jgi:hypothetical protein